MCDVVRMRFGSVVVVVGSVDVALLVVVIRLDGPGRAGIAGGGIPIDEIQRDRHGHSG